MDKETREKLGVTEGKPVDWFESLYAAADINGAGVPWANMSVHPIFKNWLDTNSLTCKGKKALVIGCGMGDDAIALEHLGFEVAAFDVSASAIELCKKRFPDSKVNFVQADLLEGIPDWKGKFDFVLEIFTVQALPPKYEKTLIQNIAEFVASEGSLMVITEVQKAKRVYEVGPPWLLNEDYIRKFEDHGLTAISNLKNSDAEIGDEVHLTIFAKE